MLKDLLKEGGLYTLANFLTKGVSLLLIPFYTAYFTPSDYGVIGMLGVFGGFVLAIVTLQLYQATGRFIAEDIALQEKQKISSTSLYFTIFLFIFFVILAFTFKRNFIKILSSDVKIKEDIFLLSIYALSINAVFYALSTQLKSLRMVNQFAITSFLHSILNIFFILFFVLELDLGIYSIYYAGIVVAPLLILLQLYFLRKYIIFYFGKEEIKKLLQFSIPLVPAAIAYLLLNLTDRFFIKEISMSANGVYEVAFKFSSIISIVIVAFQSALAPILYQGHKLEKTKLELIKIFKLFFGIGTLGVLTLSLFSYETLYFFTQPAYYDAMYILPIFYITIFFTGLGMFSPGLHIKHKTKYIPIIVIFSAIINIILNFMLVHRYELVGAAIATLVSTIINSVLLFIVSQKLYKTEYPITLVLKVFLIFLLFICFGYYINTFNNLSMINKSLIKLIVIFLYILLIFKYKLINLSLLKK